MTNVISVENLSKSYRLGQIGTGTFAHDLSVWWARLRGKPNPLLRIGEQDHGRRDGEEVWALKDVSFAVEQGEALGVIGRNGAGKSTLLKILSRVTAPTSGKVKIKGRIASLLEVGTGFHPELTGRENVYLNGAILGMSKVEVARKFDEIADFAGVEKFIDTPVKRYSSGMYVRLAFAVAAHLESEILVVDEALAVGDAEFQKKCLGKMGDAAKEGRTVLFVSHNMGAIQSLCSKSVLLDKGELVFMGASEETVGKYLSFNAELNGEWKAPQADGGGKQVFFERIAILDGRRQPTNAVKSDREFFVETEIAAQTDLPQAHIHIRLNNSEGVPIFTTSNWDDAQAPALITRGKNIFRFQIPAHFLRPGDYFLTATLLIPNAQIFDCWIDCLAFSVSDAGSPATRHGGWRQGVVVPLLSWQKEKR